jgi:tetratricopeptide (TPR) repeat protein
MKLRPPILVFGILSLFVFGCATQAPGEPEVAEYIPDASYYLLMAEIAVQRKEYLSAAKEYLNAAMQSDDPEIADRATAFAFEYGYDAFALSGARRLLEIDPDNVTGHQYAGRLYLRRNDLIRALYHWRQALGPVEQRTDDDYLDLGAELLGETNAHGVTALLSRLSTDAPDSAGLSLALAQAAYRTGAFELALVSARRAIDGGQDSEGAQILIARTLLVTGAEYQALQFMEAQLAANPSFGLELEYQSLLVAAGRTRRAMERFGDLVERYGTHPELVRVHGLISLQEGEVDEAERDFTQLVKQGQRVYESLYYLAQVALTRGDYREAIRVLSRIRGEPYLLSAQLRIAAAYGALDEPQAGLDHLDTFASDFPRYAVDVLEPRAQLLNQMGRVDDALETYDRLLRFRPDTVKIMIAKAVVLDQAGQLNEAIDIMERTVAIAPVNSAALNTLGYTLTNRTGHHKKGYELIRRALEIEPESPATIDSMGWALYRQGRLEEARSYLELAYSLLDDPELVAHLGEVLWRLGEKERARELWDRAFAADPENEPLKETRERFLRSKNGIGRQ